MLLEVFPSLNAAINQFAIDVSDFGQQWGYLSAFALSTFGNTSVFIVVPYAFVVYVLAATGNYTWWVLGLVSGLGAAIGEVTSYIVGRLAAKSKKISESEMGQKFERMRRRFEEHPRIIPFTVFIFALTPLPDDVILVPFGVMKYSYWKTIIPCWLGKTCLCLAISAVGFYLGAAIDAIEPGPLKMLLGFVVPRDPRDESTNPAQDVFLLMVLFVVIYVMIRADFMAGEEGSELPEGSGAGAVGGGLEKGPDKLLYPSGPGTTATLPSLASPSRSFAADGSETPGENCAAEPPSKPNPLTPPLGSCPTCGKLVPLDSRVCPFCGQPFAVE
ncbi:MAG: hypothetical protein Kow0069_31380 [Promethearchaeota archaeon]